MNLPALITAFFFAGGALATAIPEGATEIRMVTWPTLSPDGQSVVFEWLNQLWLAPATGGEAKRLTHTTARDAYPLFNPDGSRIVFSSERTGTMQLFSMSVAGGAAIQHTDHTEGNTLECLSPDGQRAIVSGLRERSGYRATRLMEIDLSENIRERRLFDATGHSAAWSPDGTQILFCRGGEQLFRKGYEGSRSSQLWLYDSRDQSFERLLTDETEVRSPQWHPDGLGFFYVAARDGVPNLCFRRLAHETSNQLTTFKDDGVILRNVSADGSTFLMRRTWQVLRFRPSEDSEPVALTFWTHETLPDLSRKIERVSGTSHADFTRDLSQVVFAAAGDLWWQSGRNEVPQPLTRTAAAESEVRFSPDQQWLYFLRDDGLEANYVRARWQDGTLGDEQQVTKGPLSKSRLKISPDGKQLAWVAGNGDVFTARDDGTQPRQIFSCWDRPTLDWSPNGRWLALAAKDRHSNRDIWLAASDGSRPPINLTADPAFEGSPRWSPDGRYLVFTARRNPARDAELWQIDFGAAGLAPTQPDDKIHALAASVRRLFTRGIEPTRVIWSADSSSLLFQSANLSNKRLYQLGSDGKDMSTVVEQRGVPIRVTNDGTLLWRVDRQPAILRDREVTAFPFSIRVSRAREDVLRVGFRRIWRTLGERFYDPAMNGTDWPAMLKKYEPMAVAARDSRQFDRVVGFLLGELNASHLTFRSRVWPGRESRNAVEKPTAHLGILFEEPKKVGPLMVREVLGGSPAALADEPPLPGEIVTAINDQPVTSNTPLHPFLNGAVGKELLLRLQSAKGHERTLSITCLSYAAARALDERAEAAAAKRRAEPDFAYLALKRMKWDEFADLEREIYRASLTKEGLILDLRDNGGGQVADHLLALFTQPVHAFTIPRGGPRGYPHDRRIAVAWDKPLVVICNQNTYSNAEIFCHAIQQSRRAPLTGMPTAGGVISAVKIAIPDVGILQVPFRGWFHATTGADLDLNGAVPDHLVPLTPADEAAGRDPQLQKAIQLLHEQIRGARGPIPPRRRHGG